MNMPILPQTIQVADKQTSVIQYKSVPVMTTEQMAEFYGTDVDNIRKNFSNNSGRFVDGKHYFKVEGTELNELRLCVNNLHVQISSKARSLTLWTEKGAARHAKILDTDQAWDVFEQLEEVYFSVKEKSHLPALPNFADPAEAAIAWANQYKATQAAQEQLAIAAPKAQALDVLSNSHGTETVDNCAHAMGIQPRKTLRPWMEKNNWIHKDKDGQWRAKSERIIAGHLKEASRVITDTSGTPHHKVTVYVTPKGKTLLTTRLIQAGIIKGDAA